MFVRRFALGARVCMAHGRHKGSIGTVVGVRRTFRFGWVYTVRLEAGLEVSAQEGELELWRSGVRGTDPRSEEPNP